MSSKEFAIRFCVGTPEDLRSVIWRVWGEDGAHPRSTKSDVYVSTRGLAGQVKVSLHQSGAWQFSLTSVFEKQARAIGRWKRGSRHLVRWPRPAAIGAGVTLAYRIIVPHAPPRVGQVPPRAGLDVRWIPSPAPGHAIEISLLLTAEGTPVDDWPTKHGMGTSLLASVNLHNGETLWMVWRVVPNEIVSNLRNRARIGDSLRRARDWRTDETPDLSAPDMRVLAQDVDEYGSRWIVDTPSESTLQPPEEPGSPTEVQ